MGCGEVAAHSRGRSLGVSAIEAEFQDPESGQKLAATVADVREAYRTAVRESVDEWRQHLSGAATSHEVVMTDQPFGMPQFEADPGYQFRMAEGVKALE